LASGRKGAPLRPFFVEPTLKITEVETIRLGEFPNIIWVRVHTDEGLVGLGETFMGAQAVEAYIHEWVGPKLLGKDPLAI
jgi:L-alanine-DL-glutamate epimerase-like enolase superfamily enzyme